MSHSQIGSNAGHRWQPSECGRWGIIADTRPPDDTDKKPLRYLDTEAFVNAIAPATDFGKIGRSQYSILFQIADSRKANQVTWDEFLVFQGLLKKPDAEFDVRPTNPLR